MYNCNNILLVSVGFKTSGRCLLKGGKYVTWLCACLLVILNFVLHLLSRMNDKDKQQVYGCIWC